MHVSEWKLLLLDEKVEYYKTVFEGNRVFEKFIERSISNPDIALFKNPKDGLQQVLSKEVVIEIEGLA